MDVGDLPFRYVGKHRSAKLKHVLALKSKIDAQQAALDALAQDTEALVTAAMEDASFSPGARSHRPKRVRVRQVEERRAMVLMVDAATGLNRSKCSS
jgi:hypothetical protein